MMTGVRGACRCESFQAAECLRSGSIFTSIDVPEAIPDNDPNGTSSTVTVPAGFVIDRVFVSADIQHTYRGNLEISVVAPNGEVAMLSNSEGGASKNSITVDRDISGSFTHGDPASGTWQLKVRDLAPANVGTINSFSLEVLGSSPMITTVATAPGSHIPSSPGAPSPGSTRREFAEAPACQTCDQLLFDTNERAQAKLTCLDNQLAAAAGEARLAIAARMKLLLQLAGEKLTDAQRARVEAVYDEHPQSSTSCSTPIVWDASCLPEAETRHLTTQLQLCRDLADNPNTSREAVGAELPHCFAQLASLGELGATCRLAMRDTADSIVQALLKKAQPSFAGDLATALMTALNRIDGWWLAANTLAHDDQQWLASRSGALGRWLWSSLESQRTPLPPLNPTNDTLAADFLASFAETRLAEDLSFLSHAFSPGLQTSAPPLLTFTGDALGSLATRISRLEPIHDAGCRFKPCKNPNTGVVTMTAMSQMVRALATLPDAPAFAAALADATGLQAQQPAIYGALIKIRDQHQYLVQAWNRYGRSEPFSQLASIDDPPLETAGLAAIVRDAAIAWASYQSSGIFVPWNRPRVTAATLRQSDLVSYINGAIATSNGDRMAFISDRLGVVQDLLNQSRSGAAGQSLTDQLNQLLERALALLSHRHDASSLECSLAFIHERSEGIQRASSKTLTAWRCSAVSSGGSATVGRRPMPPVVVRTSVA